MNTQACRYAIPAGLLLILLPLHRYPNLLLFTEYLFKIKHFFWWNCHSLFVIPQDQRGISGLDPQNIACFFWNLVSRVFISITGRNRILPCNCLCYFQSIHSSRSNPPCITCTFTAGINPFFASFQLLIPDDSYRG